MADQAHISDIVVPDIGTVGPDEPVRVARRRMESQTRRSLIVVQQDLPVGVVQWRDIMTEGDAEAPVQDFMVREFPRLTLDMSVEEARDHLANLGVDVDRLPVVDEAGRLVGEVPRTAVSHQQEVIETVPTAEAGASPEPWPEDRDAATVTDGSPDVTTRGTTEGNGEPSIGSGLNVVGSDDKKLGTVDQVIVDPAGRLMAFTVTHGLLGRKHKRVPADVIDHVEDDNVVVSIGHTEFSQLADIEDQE